MRIKVIVYRENNFNFLKSTQTLFINTTMINALDRVGRKAYKFHCTVLPSRQRHGDNLQIHVYH